MIKVGDTIPESTLVAATVDGPKEMTTAELFGGRKVVLFAVPGAFTPTCSAKHVPSFMQNADALAAKGVQQIACIAVNDPFVMRAWAKDQAVGDRILMLSDGMATFTKSL
ncbi:MAG: peroxiredoxin, partial [Alphaproteobacteria bacterium]